MNRLDEFFSYISENENIRDVSSLLKQRTSNPFNEASQQIAYSIQLVQESINENVSPFIDEYNSILSFGSSMTDEEREQFIQDTNKSIQEIEDCITELAKSVKEGKMGLKGQALDHSVVVFQILDKSLNKVRQQIDYLRIQRSISLNRAKSANTPLEAPMSPAHIVKKNAYTLPNPEIKEKRMPEINSQYERSLLQEHDNIVAELIDFNSQLKAADEKVENIGMIMRSFNELVSSQNQQIRIIKKDVETAQANYEEAHQQLNIAFDKAKFQHLWMAIVVIILGLLLVIKA